MPSPHRISDEELARLSQELINVAAREGSPASRSAALAATAADVLRQLDGGSRADRAQNVGALICLLAAAVAFIADEAKTPSQSTES